MKFCPNCGSKLSEESKFCPNCGYKISDTTGKFEKVSNNFQRAGHSKDHKAKNKTKIKLNYSEMFSELFKHHTTEDAEKIFAWGVRRPTLDDINVNVIHPWVFLRIFSCLFLACAVFLFTMNSSQIGIGGFAFFSALLMPFSIMVFFYEVNITHEVSFYNMLKSLLLSGILSGIIVLVIVSITSQSQTYTSMITGGMTSFDALMQAALPEEIAKSAVVAYMIVKIKPKYLLSGIAIGIAVGAGFAILETAGYITSISLSVMDKYGSQAQGYLGMFELQTAVTRGLSAFGGHVSWAAIEAGGIMLAKKQKEFNISNIFSTSFLVAIISTIILHTAWDTSFITGISFTGGLASNVKMYVCAFLAFGIVLYLTKKGIIELIDLKRINVSQRSSN